jgi:hypothetical protein
MKYDHAKPLIKELMHVAVLFHASPGMLRTKIFDALKEFIPDMDDGCFERGCPAIDHFATPVQASDEFKETVEKGTKAWAGTPDNWVDDLRGGVEKREWVGLDPETMRNTTLQFNQGALWAERYLKEKNT